jgi:hypothetical protein
MPARRPRQPEESDKCQSFWAVETPAIKFQMVQSRKTAKALGIGIAPTLLSTEDDVDD